MKLCMLKFSSENDLPPSCVSMVNNYVYVSCLAEGNCIVPSAHIMLRFSLEQWSQCL